MVREVRSLELTAPAVLMNVLAPSGLGVLDGHGIIILDSATSMLHRVSSGKTVVQDVKTQLYYPSIFRTIGGRMFAWDRRGLHTLAKSGVTIRSVQSFFSMNDFVALSDGSFLISPLFRVDGGPLVMRIDDEGSVLDAWGLQGNDSFGGSILTGQGFVTVCGGRIMVARKHDPEVNVFSMKGLEQWTWTVPIRGVDQLTELRRAPLEVVRPEPGRYFYPTFVEGIGCHHGLTYVLMALDDTLAVARFRDDGTAEVLEGRFPSGVRKHSSHFVVRDSTDGAVELSVLARDVNTRNWELLRAVLKDGTTKAQ
jgi:hypothetical protein